MLFIKRFLPLLVGVVLLWLGVKFVLPVAMPFLLGSGLALVSEPLVKRASKRFPRGISAGFGVAVTLVAVGIGVYFAGNLAVGQLKKLASAVPDLQNTANQAAQLVQDYFINLSERTPEGIRPMVQRVVLDIFDNKSLILGKLTQNVPDMIGTTIIRVGNGAIGVGTGILSAFLISARLPQLKATIKGYMPASWDTKVRPALQRLRKGLGDWFRAELKLSAVNGCILFVGFLVLRIPHSFLWAVIIAVVDAVPILGTGTVLVPWALVSFLQRNTLQGVGLLCIYGITFLTRTILEPRLVGKQLGLDPLLTLGALYLGYRFWGFLGMLFTPIVASALVAVLPKGKNP